MSSVVAIVKSIVGQVIAVSPEGIRRVLIEGDRLLAGEEVLTGPGGAVTLELADGRLLDLGRDSQWSADAPDSSTDLSQATAQAAPRESVMLRSHLRRRDDGHAPGRTANRLPVQRSRAHRRVPQRGELVVQPEHSDRGALHLQ